MKKQLFSRFSAVLIWAISGSALAANPVSTGHADPHMKVWNGRMYYAAGCDDNLGIKDFKMPYWDLYSSADLVTWRHETRIDPADTFMGKGSEECWAPDIESRNGNYYFYFSNGPNETGVLVADQPNGPYKDVLGHALVSKEFSDNLEYDPTVFTDDDGTPYLIFGRDGKQRGKMVRYQIAKLNDNMISLAEKPRDILHERPEGFSNSRSANDGSHIHKHRGEYYLSCHGGTYMSSTNIYGPYTNARSLRLHGHSSFCEFNGQTYAMYENRCLPYGNRRYRQCLMTYLHYKDNGDMVPDENFMQASKAAGGRPGRYYHTGVGNYDADWPQIEAEWFFSKSPEVEKRDGPDGGFMLRDFCNHSTVCFPLIAWTPKDTPISFNVQVLKPAKIEIREKNAEGKLLGTVQVKPGSSADTWQHVTTKLKNDEGTLNLCFRVVSNSGADDLLHLDWFSLK